MEKGYRILVINPGSTSTKVAVYDNDNEIFNKNVSHDAEKLKEFGEIQNQLNYRKETIEAELQSAGISLNDIDIFVGRGGGLLPLKGGTYEVHALNQKEVALRYCKSNGKKYEEVNLIVCHIGGGISVAAHEKGNMIDSNDLLGGEGPMMPTRSGSLPAVPLVKMCFSGKYTEKDILNRINKSGGLIDHLGTSDARDIEKRIESGDKRAKLVYDTMIYQIAKSAGACAAALKGEVEAILLTGGISHSKYVTTNLKEYLDWIAPVVVMAGEFEMEALAAGALRVLRGEEEAKEYTGIPVWQGFNF